MHTEFLTGRFALVFTITVTAPNTRPMVYIYISNSVDPAQTAPVGAVWAGSTLFATAQSTLTHRQYRNKLVQSLGEKYMND